VTQLENCKHVSIILRRVTLGCQYPVRLQGYIEGKNCRIGATNAMRIRCDVVTDKVVIGSSYGAFFCGLVKRRAMGKFSAWLAEVGPEQQRADCCQLQAYVAAEPP